MLHLPSWPGLAWGRRTRRRGRAPRSRPAPSRTMFASGLALSLCTVAVCALSVPGLVFGAAGPTGTTNEAIITPATETVDRQPYIAQTATPSVSEGSVLITLPWGDGEGQVGLQQPGEGLSRGPEALAVAPDGRIAVLDGVNSRVVFLDTGGAYLGSAPVSLAEPRFLAVTDDEVYVLDADQDCSLVQMDWAGEQTQQVALPALDDVVSALFATKHGPCIEVAHDATYLVQIRGGKGNSRATLRDLPGRPLDKDVSHAAKATFAPGQKMKIALSSVDETTLKGNARRDLALSQPPGHNVEHLVSVDGDGHGRLIVGARLLADEDDAPEKPALLLTRLAIDLPSEDTVLLLADRTFTYVGQPYVVAPNGTILQPVADENGYSLLVHSFPIPEEVE